ncbi:MAG: transcription-repair coupling factor [Bacteroidaceae bacterium]|nr:transcription-repair coupling factor [Bacteroidaceae bacterium]
MEIQELQSLFAQTPGVKALGRMLVDSSRKKITISGLYASSAPVVFSAVGLACPEALHKPYLFILDDEEQAGYFYNDLNQILNGGNDENGGHSDNICFLPSSFRRAVKYGQRDAASEILRTDALTRLSTGRMPLLIVTYPNALSELVISRQELTTNTLTLSKGQCMDIRDVQKKLLDLGFQRTDYVYEPGQFAVRGSLVDVYSFSCEHPYRMDFFGDEIDSIRTFDVENQLSIDKLTEISIVPELTTSAGQSVSLLTFLPQDTIVVTRDLVFLAQEIQRIWDEGFGMSAEITAAEENRQLDKLQLLCNPDTFNRQITGFKTVLLGSDNISDTETHTNIKPNLKFNITPQPVFHKNFDLLTTELKRCQDEKYKIYILADSQKQTDRLESIFNDINAGICFTPVSRTLHAGFIDKDGKTVIFTDHQIFDRFHKYKLRSEKARRGKMALTLKEIQQFQLGDYVVHIDHGVGRFGGLISIPEGGRMVEKIRINYDGGGVIYVSIHSLHKISKYKGQEGTPPKINKLGTGAWERLKERTKTKIKDIARDLIKLYSRRRTQKGYSFSPDTYLQTELEASFLYEDTPDQFRATQDVKNDMQNARPMDRLVCGDVGFGKTEVAIRAAFKAATDGKQVAVLVPTTVLAYQHYHTFTNRLKDMPVRVDYLSRARSPQQTKALLQDLADGKIDILIGTHRLTGKTVKWHDLGLLIIDEEQKFGVSTKEKIRQMKTNIDTLTLTATPIPRTLQFSLMGARDLSVIHTPPPNRYPIYTQLCTFSGEILAQAINFEMSRNGQTFIVCNRIASLPEIEQIVHKYVPDARVAVGHGQMSPDKLEDIILGFANYDYDVLISTTIIESGVDMPNANTIIVCQAHNFGLSDLHQMRGRVGRSNRKAFCYLLSPPLSSLTQEARRRLQAIETFSDLGSGIHIAMQDLDIRGAGNLLGAEQSGFISDLGYETYQKILSEAVRELRNDEFQDLFREKIQEGTLNSGSEFVDECQLDTDLTAHLPETYVPTSSERMLLYRELDQMETPQQIQDFQTRLQDRFGNLPPEAVDLCGMIRLRQLGKESGVERLILKQGQMRLIFVSNADSAFYQSPVFDRIIAFFSGNSARCQLRERNNQRSMIVNDVKTVSDALQILEAINP